MPVLTVQSIGNATSRLNRWCSRSKQSGLTLQALRAERKQAQSHVEKLDTAISVIESLNGTGKVSQANQPTRIISQASRRKMALAQRARRERAKNATQPVIAIAKTTGSAPVKHTMSTAARKKIAAFQKARWAKLKAQQKRAA
jgi:hypothetical protein